MLKKHFLLILLLNSAAYAMEANMFDKPIAGPLSGKTLEIRQFKPQNDNVVWAIQRNDIASVQELIKNGDINQYYFEPSESQPDTNFHRNKNTALHYAAEFGRYEIAKVLLEAGANPNLCNLLGHTPLTLCNRHTQIMQLLLHYNANPNAQTFKGNTALIYSIMRGNKEQTQLLLQFMADPTLANTEGFNAYYYAHQAGAEWEQLLPPKKIKESPEQGE